MDLDELRDTVRGQLRMLDGFSFLRLMQTSVYLREAMPGRIAECRGASAGALFVELQASFC